MQATIEINATNSMDGVAIKMALEKLAKNISKDNLTFLAKLSEKPNINAKIESKKTIIQTHTKG